MVFKFPGLQMLPICTVRYTRYISSPPGLVFPVNPQRWQHAWINRHAACDNWQMLMTLPFPPAGYFEHHISFGGQEGDRCVGLHHTRPTPGSAIQTYGFAECSYLGQTLRPPQELEYEVIPDFHAR